MNLLCHPGGISQGKRCLWAKQRQQKNSIHISLLPIDGVYFAIWVGIKQYIYYCFKLFCPWIFNSFLPTFHGFLFPGQLSKKSQYQTHLVASNIVTVSWPISVRPLPPSNGIFPFIFYPICFFCNWILHMRNRFYTWSQSKISLLSPLINGSKSTFWGCSDRRLPYSAMFTSPQLLHII